MPMESASRHECMIYDGSPSRTLPVLVTVFRRNLTDGRRCMYFNSPAMVDGLLSKLWASGLDVDHEVRRGALVLASDLSHLIDGRFAIDRMIESLDKEVDAAVASGYSGLFATGDMTWELGPEQDFAKLLDYEWRLEELFKKQPLLSGVCQYHRDTLPMAALNTAAMSHASAFISATLSRLNPHYIVGGSPEGRRAKLDQVLSLGALLALED